MSAGMLLFSIGLQSRFAEWCEALIAALAARDASGSLLITGAATSEELLQAMIETPARHVLLCHRSPGAWLHRVLAATGAHCVVLLDDPRVCVAEQAATPGCNLVEITRSIARSCAASLPYIDLSGALVLRAAEVALDPRAAARAIAGHLRLASNKRRVEAVLNANPHLILASDAPPPWEERFDAAEFALVNGALEGYAESFNGGSLGKIVWTPDLFLTENSQPLAGPIDITGPRRFLVTGPYIPLPPGRWTADVPLGFAGLGGGMDFAIDVHAGGQLAVTTINAVDDGVAHASLPFVIEPTNDIAVEVRVVNVQAAFDGRIALGPVTLTLQEGPSRELLDLLQASLQR